MNRVVPWAELVALFDDKSKLKSQAWANLTCDAGRCCIEAACFDLDYVGVSAALYAP